MILNFIDRKEELELLNEKYRMRGFDFIVIYGRRRIGKTELIKQFIKDKPHIYFLCDKGGTKRNIFRFKKKIAEFLNEPVLATEDLEEIFEYLTRKIDKKLIIVFDEFSYLVEKDAAVPSLFQVIVDEILNKKNIMLVLCGSSISMMEKGVLSYKSPLYGRKTAHIKLSQISFKYHKDFFPQHNTHKNIEVYSVVGGIPFYLEKFSGKKSLTENIKEQILGKKGGLYDEVYFLLREELREPDVYKAILEAIASGSTKVVEIANKSKIKVQDIDKYLKVLISLGIIKKENPITEKKSKKTIYTVDDNFFNFYFKFVEPYKSDIEVGELSNVEKKLRDDLNKYIGSNFEKLIREEIIRKLNIFQIQRVGRWWGHYREKDERKEAEIDIVALNEDTREILFCECKWQKNVNAEKILSDIKRKACFVNWKSKRGYYAIFAKSFSKRTKEAFCFDIEDIEKIMMK
ncbi:MAG: ATP-binding protein [Candidatus Thermoplasmatota archaeon]